MQGDENTEGCCILSDTTLLENVNSLKSLAALGPDVHPLRNIDGMLVWESPSSVGEVSKVCKFSNELSNVINYVSGFVLKQSVSCRLVRPRGARSLDRHL